MTPQDLHWTESDIESIDVDGRSLTVVASKVFVLGGLGPRRIRATFVGVSSARLEVTEYVGSPRAPEGFKAPYVVEKLDPIQGRDLKVFGIEGISTFEPIAWLDLEVNAQEAIIEELDTSGP